MDTEKTTGYVFDKAPDNLELEIKITHVRRVTMANGNIWDYVMTDKTHIFRVQIDKDDVNYAMPYDICSQLLKDIIIGGFNGYAEIPTKEDLYKGMSPSYFEVDMHGQWHNKYGFPTGPESLYLNLRVEIKNATSKGWQCCFMRMDGFGDAKL